MKLVLPPLLGLAAVDAALGAMIADALDQSLWLGALLGALGGPLLFAAVMVPLRRRQRRRERRVGEDAVREARAAIEHLPGPRAGG
jgi:hypothetical protein